MKARFLTVVLILSGLFVTATTSYACNLSPEAIPKAIREYVIVGGRAVLDGNDPCEPSYDPDGYITKYEWDFDYTGTFNCDYYETSSYYPDGAFDGRTMSFVYDGNGTYTVALRVTDNGSPGLTDIDDCYVYVGLDSDNDGMPDDWEDLYGLDPNDANDADVDSNPGDGDGYNNLCEYLHGTEPNDDGSKPDPNFLITIYVPSDVNSIQRAINASINGDIIVVSEGTYYEAIDFNGRSCTLTSTDPNDWDVIANTIIDADASDVNVVTFDDSEYANSVLSGFTITGGARGIYCGGASPTITNCTITDNNGTNISGAGMYCEHSASPTITNCIFSGNTANYLGGGICNYNESSPTVTNCVFSENGAVGGGGGGICNFQACSPTLINCTFNGNSAYNGGDGGGMWNYGTVMAPSDPIVTNCTFWGNDAEGSGDEIYNWDDNSDPNFSFCDIEGSGGSGGWDPNFGSDDGNNIDIDPNFIDAGDPAGPDGVFGTFDDGLRLQRNSPCIDAGDPNTDSNDVGTVDLTGYDRFMDGDGDGNDVVDMGAYELPLIWFVDIDATGSNNGSSWEDAFTDLQDALLADANDGDEIWVAEGPYEPNAGSDRSVSFELVEGVGVYGGFGGTEVSRHQRDWTAHETILSGDIGTPSDHNDNSYHVVKGANNAVLDGFTITGGNANGSSPDNAGGGIYCSNTSPTIANCTIVNNNAVHGGGMYSNSASPTVTDCFFSGNSAGGEGGGMCCNGASPTISNCTFSGNASGFFGGGVSNRQTSNLTITNCTFSTNSAIFGGGMYSEDSNPKLTNCIFWGNEAYGGDEIYGDYLTLTYCDVEGGYWGTGNINSDPCFVDVNNPAGMDGVFGTYDDGLRLLANSPCIDAADGDAAQPEDILGLDRIDINDVNNTGTGDPNYVDIGVYESYASAGGLDSDGDGMPDDWEILNGLNPNDANDANWDLDGDGLSNLLEYQIGTWPNSDDTDKDGMKDGWEYNYGLDPLDDSDASEDLDGDDKTNLQEYNAGTNPIIHNAISVIVYEYDNAGQVTKETIQDGDGNNVAVTQYQYDELGRRWQQRRRANVSSSDDANDMITLYSYDVRGNLKKTVQKVDPNASAIEPNDLVTKNFYDSLGRLTDVNDNGLVTKYTYYKGGEPNQVTDPNGNITTNYYDNAGRLEETVDAEDHYRVNYYDSLGRTIKQIAYDCNSTPDEANDDFALMQTRFEYNGLGSVTRRAVMADADSTGPIYDSNDMVVDYNYPADGNGLLTSEIRYYASGTAATTSYEYDDLGRRTKITDPAGNHTLVTYDEMGRIARRQQIEDDPLGSNDLTITTCYIYNSLGGVYKQVAMPDVNDSNTWHVTTYYYNALGNRTKETRPNAVVVEYSYNALGRLVEKIADYGTGKINQKTEYSHDRLGRQTSITGYADGSTAQTTNYTYDKLNRITNVEYPNDHDIGFEYNPAGKVAKRIDQRGIVTTYAYDGTYNMLTKSVDGDSVIDDASETFTYDGLGRMLTATKDVNSTTISETEFAYNDISKITDTNETYFADSNTTKTISYAYDQAGHPNSIDYPNGSTINITPDWQGRIDTVKLSSTTIATYKYIGSRVAQRSYPTPGITYQPSYDNLGRITSADSNTSYAKFDYEYAANTNNISKQTYVHRDVNNPPATDFYYDNLDRLTVAEYGIEDNNEVFTMDDLGNRTNVNLRNGNDVAYTVDNLTNRYTSIFEDTNNLALWTMDDNEPNTTVLDSSGNGYNGTFIDPGGNPNTDAHHTTGKVNGALTFDGTDDYIDVGDEDSLDFGASDSFSIAAWVKPASSAVSVVNKRRVIGGTYLEGYFLRVVQLSNQTQFSIEDTGSTSVSIIGTTQLTDDWHHIVGVRDTATDKLYLYFDGVSVATPVTDTTTATLATTQALLIGRTPYYGYYFNGDIDDVMMCEEALSDDEVKALYNSASLSYDETGNLTADKDSYQYEYDYENRIVKITKDSSDIAEFAYDALGRRIEKKDLVDANNTRRYYYNNNWQVLCEYDGAGSYKKLFIYGNYIDEVLYTQGTNPGTRNYYVHDHLYSPVALVYPTGTVRERCEYDAYGNCSILEPNFAPDPDGKSDYGNNYLFTGRRLDILDNSSLKIQYNRNRYYDYYTGRFTTHDLWGINPAGGKDNSFEPRRQYNDGLSLYEYLNSNPIAVTDPTGLNAFGYISRRCFCACGLRIFGTWRNAKQALALGYGIADIEYDRYIDPRRHKAMRHCVASGALAKSSGCGCSECIGTKLEDWQEKHTPGDSARWGQLNRNANTTGRLCAGCYGIDGSRDHPPRDLCHIADPDDISIPYISYERIIECCKKAVEGGYADIDRPIPLQQDF